jgi:hypothetical protein
MVDAVVIAVLRQQMLFVCLKARAGDLGQVIPRQIGDPTIDQTALRIVALRRRYKAL